VEEEARDEEGAMTVLSFEAPGLADVTKEEAEDVEEVRGDAAWTEEETDAVEEEARDEEGAPVVLSVRLFSVISVVCDTSSYGTQVKARFSVEQESFMRYRLV
jgi:hypothetical protein